jgi:hypothetical protein
MLLSCASFADDRWCHHPVGVSARAQERRIAQAEGRGGWRRERKANGARNNFPVGEQGNVKTRERRG